MKKYIIFIFTILIIIVSIFFYWYTNLSKENRLTKQYNSEYEIYTNKEIKGTDLTTIINKAINNNERYSVSKDEKGLYNSSDENSIKIFIKIEKDSDFYPMEAFYLTNDTEYKSINSFRKAFGSANFKCTSIEYHNNNRISKIFFEIMK